MVVVVVAIVVVVVVVVVGWTAVAEERQSDAKFAGVASTSDDGLPTTFRSVIIHFHILFYRVFYWYTGCTGLYRVLLGFAGLNRVLLGFTEFYLATKGLTRLYRGLPRFTGFY